MINIDFNQHSTEELRELNRSLVEHLKLRRVRESQKSMDQFNLYDTVSFTDSEGNTIEGKIIRFNQKSVTVERECGHGWRVPPQLLKKVSSENPKNLNAMLENILKEIP